MKFFLRLLAYVRPYTLQALASILFMAMVGLLDAFRILLVKADLRSGAEAFRYHPAVAALQHCYWTSYMFS